MDRHALDPFLQSVLARMMDDGTRALPVCLREWWSPRTVGSRLGAPAGPPYLPSLTITGMVTVPRWLPLGGDSLRGRSSSGLACRCPVVLTGAAWPYKEGGDGTQAYSVAKVTRSQEP